MRVFLAIDLPDPVREGLIAAQRRIESQAPGFYRWVDPADMHLTLYFLGEMEGVAKIVEVCSGVASEPFSLSVGGLVLLPERHSPRIVASGVTGEVEKLVRLQQRVSDTVFPFAEFKETRRYYPHITLGRLKRGMPGNAKVLKRVLAETRIEASALFSVGEFVLKQSVRDEKGSHYETLHRFALR